VRLLLGLARTVDTSGGFANGGVERSKFGVVQRRLAIDFVESFPRLGIAKSMRTKC
jgi:hypothetical protein